MNKLLHLNRYIFILIKIFILWGFLFDISVKMLPLSTLFSSRKIIILLLCCYYLRNIVKKNDKIIFEIKTYFNKIKELFFIILLITIYSTLILFINGNNLSGNSFTINRLGYLLITILIGTFFVQKIFRNQEEFITSLIGAISIEAGSALLQFLFVPIKNFYDLFFLQSGNLSYLTYYRAVGIGCEGALLSIYLSIGFIFSLYKIYLTVFSLKYCFIAFFLFFVNLFTGKTGLIINIISLFIFLIILVKKYKLLLFNKKLLLMFFLCLVPFIAVIYFGNGLWINNAIERTMQIFREGINDDSIQDLIYMFKNTKIPTEILLFGSGITFGETSRGLVFINDSGYIKSIFGYGLIFAILYYYSIFKDFIKKSQTLKYPLNVVMLYLILIFIICEFKEPFLLKGPLFFIVISLYFIQYREGGHRF